MIRTHKKVCPVCEGTGKYAMNSHKPESRDCTRCKGERVLVDVTFEVNMLEYELRGKANKFKLVEL